MSRAAFRKAVCSPDEGVRYRGPHCITTLPGWHRPLSSPQIDIPTWIESLLTTCHLMNEGNIKMQPEKKNGNDKELQGIPMRTFMVHYIR